MQGWSSVLLVRRASFPAAADDVVHGETAAAAFQAAAAAEEEGAWHVVVVALVDRDETAVIPTRPSAVDPHDAAVACVQHIVRVDDDGDVDDDGHGMDDRVHAVSRVVVVVDGEEEDQGLDGQKQLWAHLLDSQLRARGFEQMRDSQWWVCGLVQL